MVFRQSDLLSNRSNQKSINNMLEGKTLLGRGLVVLELDDASNFQVYFELICYGIESIS